MAAGVESLWHASARHGLLLHAQTGSHDTILCCALDSRRPQGRQMELRGLAHPNSEDAPEGQAVRPAPACVQGSMHQQRKPPVKTSRQAHRGGLCAGTLGRHASAAPSAPPVACTCMRPAE